jgi:hypothetical protein
MLRRTYRTGLLAVLASVAAVIATVQVQQQMVRIRAEHLLSDIRVLELRKSTWSDAQKIFARWDAWGQYDGLCNSSNCDYRIELGDSFSGQPRFPPNSPWVRRAYGFLGVRMNLIKANVLVKDGFVLGKGFTLFLEIPPEGGPNAAFAGNGYTLIGASESVSRFVPAGSQPQLVMHPQYTITTPGGCTGCLAVFVKFTPYADPSDVARLMDVNVGCLTSRKLCRGKEDIMPTAWRQYTAESNDRDSERNDPTRCAYPLMWRARDTDNAVVVDVVSNRTEKEADPFQVSVVRLVKRLKGASFWEIGTTREIRVFPGTTDLASANLPKGVSPGGRFIMLFQHSHRAGRTGPEVWLDRCGTVPLTDPNLDVVRRGIEHDFESSAALR